MNWQEDITDDYLPEEIDNYNKAPGTFRPGERIGWWYADDEKFAAEEGIDHPSKDPPFQGVVVPRPGIEFRGGDFEAEDALVVECRSPVEKCYPEVTYGALRRLLDYPQLARVISLENAKAESHE